jgi:hypothetical protein
MATATRYTYQITKDSLDVVRVADEIHTSTGHGTLVFIYSTEDGLIYPQYIPDTYTGEWNLAALSPEEFLKQWELKGAKITAITRRDLSSEKNPGLRCIGIKKYIDYPRMIDDLERAGKIKTKASTGFMATDPRKFWFLGDTQQYEVDCLGTGLCKYISERVSEEWMEIQARTS